MSKITTDTSYENILAFLVTNKYESRTLTENVVCVMNHSAFLYISACQFKEEGNYRESIQTNTTSDPKHCMGKRQKHKKMTNTREPRGQPFHRG